MLYLQDYNCKFWHFIDLLTLICYTIKSNSNSYLKKFNINYSTNKILLVAQLYVIIVCNWNMCCNASCDISDIL